MAKSSLSGATNHRLYRNYFSPSKGVVDGDFCELFLSLPEPERVRLGSSLGKEPQAIAAILSEMQSKFA